MITLLPGIRAAREEVREATLLPVADAYVCLNYDTGKNFGRDGKLLILNDGYGFEGVKGHESAMSYIKFKLPEGVKSNEDIVEAKLKIYIYNSAHCGSTVTITAKSINVLTSSSNWEENKITGSNAPATSFCYKKTLVECSRYPDCGKQIRLDGCKDYEKLGEVEFDLTGWLNIENGYTTVVLEPGDVNNAFAAYSKDADVGDSMKPRLVLKYKPHVEEVPPSEVPVEIPPEGVEVVVRKERGLRSIFVQMGKNKGELKRVGDTFTCSISAPTEFVAYATPSLLGYKFKVRPAEGKKVVIGFPWKVSLTNVEVV